MQIPKSDEKFAPRIQTAANKIPVLALPVETYSIFRIQLVIGLVCVRNAFTEISGRYVWRVGAMTPGLEMLQ